MSSVPKNLPRLIHLAPEFFPLWPVIIGSCLLSSLPISQIFFMANSGSGLDLALIYIGVASCIILAILTVVIWVRRRNDYNRWRNAFIGTKQNQDFHSLKFASFFTWTQHKPDWLAVRDAVFSDGDTPEKKPTVILVGQLELMADESIGNDDLAISPSAFWPLRTIRLMCFALLFMGAILAALVIVVPIYRSQPIKWFLMGSVFFTLFMSFITWAMIRNATGFRKLTSISVQENLVRVTDELRRDKLKITREYPLDDRALIVLKRDPTNLGKPMTLVLVRDQEKDIFQLYNIVNGKKLAAHIMAKLGLKLNLG